MDLSNNFNHEDDKTGLVVMVEEPLDRRPSRHVLQSRHVSVFEEMRTIPESEEASFQDTRTTRNVDTALLRNNSATNEPASPSIFRRITTRLSSPRLPSPTAQQTPIPLAPFRSLRRSRGPGYENLHDNDDDLPGVPVDLTVLSGLGFDMYEGNQNYSDPWLSRNLIQESPAPEAQPVPSFQSLVQNTQPQLGSGLVVGAQLRRAPSVRPVQTPAERAEEVRRSRSVRNTAQNIAQERNMIVAVSESVDLSLLEGHALRPRSTQDFDSMLNRRGTFEDQPQSYFFPEDPDVPNWRPATMSTPYILFLAAAAFALAGCQEYLCQKSEQLERKGEGILFFNDVSSVSVGDFFIWKYLPTMICIIYAVMFSVMDFDIRRLEPFYQLSQPQGSPASESLNVDHLTMFQYFVPFKALRLRQWTVFFSTIGNIIASTASPALQNPSIDFNPNPKCDIGLDKTINCPQDIAKYVVIVVPTWSRLVTASYIIVGIMTVILFFQLRRKSGLLSDPKGIAGIASMATKSHILREFRGTDLATRQDIQNRLAHRRFILYKSSIWQGEWTLESKPEPESATGLASPHPPMLRLSAGYPFIAVQVLCLVAVPIITVTPANKIPNAAPWLPILIATILKLVWSTFEADVRLMEPFYQLSRGNCSAENGLTLDYQSTIYGLLPFKAAYNGHWLLCIVGVCSVALDVLTVTVASFSIKSDDFYHTEKDRQNPASSGSETRVSFLTSFFLSILILLFVIFTTILVYLRRRHPFLPREPSTIASVLAFIYASKMLEDFIDTEWLTNQEMEQRLKSLKKKYALGWFRGRDGQIHVAIDEEPMRSRYRHGYGYRYDQAMAGPVDAHGGYYA